MQVSLANAITTTTNGPTVAVQPKNGAISSVGKHNPVILRLDIAATGTSGAQSIIFDIEGSLTGLGSWTAIKTYTLDGTYTKKSQTFEQKVRDPYIRVNVTTISGTGASLSANASILG